MKIPTINADSATLPTQLPAYQSKSWQRSYLQCVYELLA